MHAHLGSSCSLAACPTLPGLSLVTYGYVLLFFLQKLTCLRNLFHAVVQPSQWSLWWFCRGVCFLLYSHRICLLAIILSSMSFQFSLSSCCVWITTLCCFWVAYSIFHSLETYSIFFLGIATGLSFVDTELNAEKHCICNWRDRWAI